MNSDDGLAVLIAIVVMVVVVIGALISIGWLILAAIALVGAVAGVIVGLKNFFEELDAAHKAMPFGFSVAVGEYTKKLFVPQNAHLMYPFESGWQVMKYVQDNVYSRTEPQAKWFFKQAEPMQLNAKYETGTLKKYYYYCAYLGLMLAGALQYVMAFAIVVVFCILQFILLALWMVLVALVIGVLSLLNFLYSRVYRIFVRCPDCHAQMPIPVYICPNCSSQHSRLWPSVYGVFYHTCTCKAHLPTFDLFGRRKLTQRCAACNTQMNESIGREINVHIPVIGGPSTGKSNFIFQATREFIDVYVPPRKIQVSFPDEMHKRNYEMNKGLLSAGKALLKTPDILPQAYNLSVRRRWDRIGKVIYIYDAAGEAYSIDANILQQKKYFNYIHGLIFLIDPFSVENYHRLHQAEIKPILSSLRPSSQSVMDTYSRMVVLLESTFGVKPGEPFRLPLAVVVSKTDALGLDHEIGRQAAHALMARDPAIRTDTDAMDCLVEQWLVRNQMGNFVRDVKMRFKNVHFFSCSALGRLPDPANPTNFKANNVLDPFLWVLSEAGVVNIARERGRQIDALDLKALGARGNVFQKLKYYYWDSLSKH